MEGKLTQDLFYHWMVNYQFGDFHTGGTTSDLDSFNFLVNLDYFVDHKIIRNVGIEFTVSSGNDADSDEVETFIPAYGNKTVLVQWIG